MLKIGDRTKSITFFKDVLVGVGKMLLTYAACMSVIWLENGSDVCSSAGMRASSLKRVMPDLSCPCPSADDLLEA